MPLLLVCCARPCPSWCGSRVLCVCVASPPVCWRSWVPLSRTPSCPTRLPPPYKDFTSPCDVDCPVRGWLVMALLPPPWRTPPPPTPRSKSTPPPPDSRTRARSHTSHRVHHHGIAGIPADGRHHVRVVPRVDGAVGRHPHGLAQRRHHCTGQGRRRTFVAVHERSGAQTTARLPHPRSEYCPMKSSGVASVKPPLRKQASHSCSHPLSP